MTWQLRTRGPVQLSRPVAVDPTGVEGPTAGQSRGPRWRRAVPGLYVPVAADRDVPEQRILEESMRLPPQGAVTGWAAIRLHGAGYFDGLGRDGKTELPVPLVVPPGVTLGRRAGTTVQRERLTPR